MEHLFLRKGLHGHSCYSVAKSCLTLRPHGHCSTPGSPVLHYLPEFTHTHVHWVGDAIQPSHPLSLSPLPASSVTVSSSCLQNFPASGSFPMSWLFISGGQNSGASSLVLPINIQGWFPLGLIYMCVCVCVCVCIPYIWNTTQWNTTQPGKKRMKFCHLQQHGWTWRVLCWVK